jgi:hypothetical protein
MKCQGCKWKTEFYDLTTSPPTLSGRFYCIGSPDHETPEEYKHLIDQSRIIRTEDDPFGVYEVFDSDECVLWHSERFTP